MWHSREIHSKFYYPPPMYFMYEYHIHQNTHPNYGHHPLGTNHLSPHGQSL
jgi:hypothetical protein